MAVARIAGRHHAVEHVDAGLNRMHQILRRTDTHQVTRLVRRHFGRGMSEDARHVFFRFADRKAADGHAYDGASKYVMHFPKCQMPPVSGFWSLTMYDKESYLVPNTLNRYALGDRSHLTFDDDGSLTLYIQKDSPGGDKKANWLPTPAQGGFKLALRLYAPKSEVTNGEWVPPAVKRID